MEKDESTINQTFYSLSPNGHQFLEEIKSSRILGNSDSKNSFYSLKDDKNQFYEEEISIKKENMISNTPIIGKANLKSPYIIKTDDKNIDQNKECNLNNIICMHKKISLLRLKVKALSKNFNEDTTSLEYLDSEINKLKEETEKNQFNQDFVNLQITKDNFFLKKCQQQLEKWDHLNNFSLDYITNNSSSQENSEFQSKIPNINHLETNLNNEI